MRRTSFSLAVRSSRRRRLAIALNADAANVASAAQPNSAQSQSSSRAALAKKRSPPPADIAAADARETVADDFAFPASSENDEHAQRQTASLRQQLQSNQAMTWIFAGDSDLCSTVESVETFPRLVAHKLKHACGRRGDTFVNATRSNATIGQFHAKLPDRLAKFAPQVVVIVCGFGDCLPGVATFQSFEHELMQVICLIRQAGATPIICTPPGSDVPETSLEFIDRLIYVESIRACAVEHNAVLIDNWDFWQNRSDATRLWDLDESRPTQIGIHELQRLFFNELGLLKELPPVDRQRPNSHDKLPAANS